MMNNYTKKNVNQYKFVTYIARFKSKILTLLPYNCLNT